MANHLRQLSDLSEQADLCDQIDGDISAKQDRTFSLNGLDPDWDLVLDTTVTQYQDTLQQPGKYEELKEKIYDNIYKVRTLASVVDDQIEQQRNGTSQGTEWKMEAKDRINRMDFMVKVTQQLTGMLLNVITSICNDKHGFYHRIIGKGHFGS